MNGKALIDKGERALAGPSCLFHAGHPKVASFRQRWA